MLKASFLDEFIDLRAIFSGLQKTMVCYGPKIEDCQELTSAGS